MQFLSIYLFLFQASEWWI